MTQFAILRHEYPLGDLRRDHWDLLLEPPKTTEETPLLLCFAIQAPISAWDGSLVQKLPDHRRLYLHYEGPISNDRGTVQRLATGEIAWHEVTPHFLRCELKCLSSNGPIEWSTSPIHCQLRKQPTAPEPRNDGSFSPGDQDPNWWRLEWHLESHSFSKPEL